MTRLLAATALALWALLAGQPARAEPAQATYRVFLPALAQPAGPPALVRFGSGLAGGELTGVGTRFAAGGAALFYEVAVEGGAGLPFRLEWAVGGERRPELDRAGTVPADGGPVLGGIALSTGGPLPAGAYELRVFVAGLPAGAGRTAIE